MLLLPSSSADSGLLHRPALAAWQIVTDASVPDHNSFLPTPRDIHLQNAANSMAHAVNQSTILQAEQRHTIQVLATTTATLSVTAVLFALYWFCMMRRNFRRDLVLLLIIGDAWKSLWYMIFSSYTFVNGQVQTGSGFCEVNGYMLQTGIMSCDIAILLMSLHMYLQIFPPSHSFLGHDGLYRARHTVVAVWFLIPNLSASLAFVGLPAPAYITTGAWCTLPIRPFWYRLALSWVPRYLIWIFVMGVAIKIYRHVGKEFQVFGHERDASSSIEMPGQSSVDRAVAKSAMKSQRRRSPPRAAEDVEKQISDDAEIAPDDTSVHDRKPASPAKHSFAGSSNGLLPGPGRRQSTPNWSVGFGPASELSPAPISTSNPESRRGSKTAIAAGVLAEDFAPSTSQSYDYSRHRGSITTLGSLKSAGGQSVSEAPALPPIEEARNSVSTVSNTGQKTAQSVVLTRRRAIQRQLRLLFIYPVVYMMLWIVPFISHCMNYSDYYAQHPVFVISAMNTFCQCFLGFADVYVFCWRERPWKHIPGSDGTFLGSLCFWRFSGQLEWHNAGRRASAVPSPLPGNKEKDGSRLHVLTTVLASLTWWSTSDRNQPDGHSPMVPRVRSRPPIVHRRQHSGGSDRRQLEIQQAHERLALERTDWEHKKRDFQERRTSVVSMQQASSTAGSKQTKEWWDRPVDNDL